MKDSCPKLKTVKISSMIKSCRPGDCFVTSYSPKNAATAITRSGMNLNEYAIKTIYIMTAHDPGRNGLMKATLVHRFA